MRSSLSLATGLDRAFSILAKRDLHAIYCRHSLWQRGVFVASLAMGAPVGEIGGSRRPCTSPISKFTPEGTICPALLIDAVANTNQGEPGRNCSVQVRKVGSYFRDQ